MTAYTLGIDIGTSGAKVIVIDLAGRVIASHTHEYPLSSPHPQWSEQNPEDWWQATIVGVQRVLAQADIDPSRIGGVGLSGQMHGAIFLDKKGDLLRPAILWNDQRTAAQCQSLTAMVGAKRVIQLTANPVMTGFTAPKILWVKEHEPDLFARIDAILLPKDYIRYRLTGERFGEVSDASGTALFDVANRCWSAEMLGAVGVEANWLPQVTESTALSTKVSTKAAGVTGLLAGTPVVGGAGDQAAQAVGTGIISEGLTAATIGTSGVIFATSDTFRVDPEGRLHSFCHAIPDKWHLMGVMLSAGGSLQWYRHTFGVIESRAAAESGSDPYDLLLGAAAATQPGADGLTFLPYLTGERTPHADPAARGALIGFTARHTKAQVTRAVVEGISFGLRDSLELMGQLGIRSTRVRASGGGARSSFWRQMLANVFATPITTVGVNEGAAFGAALLAQVGCGMQPSVEEACAKLIKPANTVEPTGESELYEKLYRRFTSLYPCLARHFKTL